METKEDYTESFTYMVDILDNGITLSIPEQDYVKCEKFSNEGKFDDEAIIKFLGRNLWGDICSFADCCATNSIRIELKLSKNE